jgi:hypothetical protein
MADDDIFLADEVSERGDAIGYQFRCSTRSVAWLTTAGLAGQDTGSRHRLLTENPESGFWTSVRT